MQKAIRIECPSRLRDPQSRKNPNLENRPARYRRRVRGRRPGRGSTCRARLKGWIQNVARRSPIWGDVDLRAFCKITGYSREHATRELSKIRRSGEFAFETKLRTRPDRRRRNWGVIVADPRKLRFDRRSLHFTSDGKPLHNRTSLASEGVKLMPPSTEAGSLHCNASSLPVAQSSFESSATVSRPACVLPRAQGNSCSGLRRGAFPQQMSFGRSGCDNAYKGDSFGIQQSELYGAVRPIAQWRGPEASARRKKAMQRLRRRAFALVPKLKESHWDNCKVHFNPRGAFSLAHDAIRGGHDAERIVACYEQALFKTHGHAVDQAASTGQLVFFNLSSTILETRRLLAGDGLTREKRISSWYERRRAMTAEILAAFEALQRRLGTPESAQA